MYYIVYGALWLFSLLPMRVLYFIADAIYGLVYYVLKYRRDVVMKNLMIVFPEKTEKERKQIAKKFYRNLIDTFIETIKLFSASRAFILKRFKANWEVVNQFKSSGKNVQVHAGHNFNWEWGNIAAAFHCQMPFIGVYMPMSNKIFDRIFLKLRTRGGTIMISAKKMAEEFAPYKDKQYLLALAADQNPGHPGNAWWFNFFGKPTPFLKGPAKGAFNNQTVVIFAFIHKIERGYYEAVLTVAEKDGSLLSQQELTQKFVKYLENVIREYPDMWLWSHRRWKAEWKPEYGPVLE